MRTHKDVSTVVVACEVVIAVVVSSAFCVASVLREAQEVKSVTPKHCAQHSLMYCTPSLHTGLTGVVAQRVLIHVHNDICVVVVVAVSVVDVTVVGTEKTPPPHAQHASSALVRTPSYVVAYLVVW